MEQKYRLIPPHLPILDHDHVTIVQHEPAPLKPGSENSVVRLPDGIPQDNDPKVVRGNPRLLQSGELCNRVIFAVTSAPGKGGQG